jgi:membrane protein implicated in regulation of membrane protease activity
MVNTIIGLLTFAASLMIGATLWYIGASPYWQGLVFLFGGCGLLLVLTDAVYEKESEDEPTDEWMNDSIFQE